MRHRTTWLAWKAKEFLDSLDPSRSPGKVRTFKDMTEEERRKMADLYTPPARLKDRV